jgi:PKD repeat protein
MKIKKTTHLTSILVILAIFSLFSIISYGTPHAAMPNYQWQDSISVNAPTAVDVDQEGNIYVAEASKNRLLIINSDGNLLNTLSGLHKPTSIAVHEGQGGEKLIFIGNKGTGNVSVYDGTLKLLHKLGSGDGEFGKPNAVAVDGNGNAYVVDRKEDAVKVYNPDGSFNSSFGGTGNGDGQFNSPVAIAIDEVAGEIVVSDMPATQGMFGASSGVRIQVFDVNGTFKRSFGEYGTIEGLTRPFGVEVDSEGRIYVSDALYQAVQVFDSTGTYLGVLYSEENPMVTPLDITFDLNDRLYIASLVTGTVEVYQVGDLFPDITVTPASFDFGEIETGSSTAVIFTVENNGTADLAIDAVNPPLEPFSITSDACSGQSLVPTGNCTIEITFAPTDAATFAGNFTIQSNDPDEASLSVSLTGTGVVNTSLPVADFSASPTNGPAPLTVTFTNNSSGVNLPLSYAWDFEDDGIIDSSDENPFHVYDEGTYSVTLTVTDSSGVTSTLTRTNYITVSTASYTLRVNIGGNGSVVSSPSGITCPGDCSEEYASGAGVVLTATAEENWSFSGWSGACSGTGSCVVTMDSDLEVTATFECTISFTDLPVWAEEYILAVACEGIMDGYDDGTFQPYDKVTRADMAEFIIRGVYGDDFIYSSTPYFPDVPETHPAFKYIQKMYEEGIATGYDDGTYKPSRKVNRAQMSIFIIRALYGDDFSYSSTPYFPDVPETHPVFKYTQKMYEEGIATGYDDGSYKPLKKVNRAQMAVFLARAFLGF